VAHRRIRAEGLGEDLIANKPLSRHWAPRHVACTGRTPRGDRAPSVLWLHSGYEPGGMGRQRPPPWGSHHGPWPSGPMSPWAAVRPKEIVDFSIFLWIYSIQIQIHFGLNLNLSKFVQTEYLNAFNSSLWIQIGKSELGFPILLNLIKPFGNTHRVINSLEIHSKFHKSPKIMKLASKFIIFPAHLVN
jgi:hypothetical protein